MKKEYDNKKIIINLSHIKKTYHHNDKNIEVLKDINISLKSGKFYAIMGHSGSGKSTLINILGLIDTFDTGIYNLYGETIINLDDFKSSKMRMKHIGFVFQEFYLKSTLKAYENVMLPMLINKNIQLNIRKEKATKLLEMVGLKDRIEHFPKELSGGEQQRVAIARALANNPSIILADEPTGNLDFDTEKEIFSILKKLSQEGKCVIVVSHSEQVKKFADEVFYLKNGVLVGDKCEI